MFKRVTAHLEENNVLYCKQYGFRKNHSTNDAIIDLVSEILQSNENKLDVLAVFIDLKKAFDTCNYKTILDKLRKCGIDDALLLWFTNYFIGRSQYCFVNGRSSDTQHLTIGVPQGSLLGVLCFQIVITDLHKSLKWCRSLLYADDTTILIVGQNLKFMVQKLNKDLEHLSSWLAANRLCLNTKKTKFMLFSRLPYEGDIILKVDNELIEMVDKFKFLGFVIDSQLSCLVHYDMLYSKLLSVDYVIRKIGEYVPKKCLRTMYYSFFHSHFIYGLNIWGTLLNKSHLDKLFNLQKRVIRHVARKLPFCHTAPIFKELRILTLQDQILLENVKLMHRVINNVTPIRIIKLFEKKHSST